MEDILIDRIVSDYLDKIYLYCVKRTNVEDALDLSQTIITDIIINIRKGIVPNNLDYYVWKVVKNQYARYIDTKVKSRNIITDNIELEEYPSDQISNISLLIEDEKIESIKRALKILSKEYSSILVAYYIDDLSIKEIASITKLPEGTVKYKLYNLRQKLKEVIALNKLNGKKTYAPDDLAFGFEVTANGKDGSPWSLISTLIQKNILLHANENPSTLEDLAIELGISLPYIEEIVNTLYSGTLLKKVDNKYQTNFTIIFEDKLKEIKDYVNSVEDELGNDVFLFLDACYKDIKEIKFIGSDLKKEYLYWNLLEILYDPLERERTDYKISERPQGGKWDAIAYCNLKYDLELFFVGINGDYSFDNNIGYFFHDIRHPNIMNRTIRLINDKLIEAIKLITIKYNGKIPLKDLIVEDNEIIESINKLRELNLVIDIDEYYKSNFMICTEEEIEKIYQVFTESNLIDKVIHHYQKFKEWIIDNIDIYDNKEFVVKSMLSWFRSSIILYGIKNNLLSLDLDNKMFAYNVFFKYKI